METRNTIKTLDADLRRIKYNAFTLAPILMSFYKECQIAKDNVLLAYLVFPILYSEKWKNFNNIRINRNSRLDVWVLNDKMPLMGLNDRISFFSKYTTTSFAKELLVLSTILVNVFCANSTSFIIN